MAKYQSKTRLGKNSAAKGTAADQRKYLKRLVAAAEADGWEVELVDGMMYPSGTCSQPGTQTVVVKKVAEGRQLFFRICRGDGMWSGAHRVEVSGTTRFTRDGAWYSFDRTGVDDSFHTNETEDPATVIRAQDKRINERVEYYRTALGVPGIPYTVSPERKAELVKLLASGKPAMFYPSGFGTGYRLLPKVPNGVGWARRGSDEMAKFFGLDAIWVESIECD